MLEKKSLIAALAATTFLTAGVAYAADQAAQPAPTSQEQKTLDTDAGKLSADGTRAFNDVALTRLAIFDGRIKDAKTFVSEADTSFDKAKADDSVFIKAEADLKTPDQGAGAADAKADQTAGSKDQKTAGNADMKTPKKWLPVDAEMSVNEDFTANPKKAAAVADANKSLAKGDKQGAMAKLKLADVDVSYVMAVVPLDQTLTDVHQAMQEVDSGKYYEASQTLRQVQDSTRYDLLNVNGVPTAQGAKGTDVPATH